MELPAPCRDRHSNSCNHTVACAAVLEARIARGATQSLCVIRVHLPWVGNDRYRSRSLRLGRDDTNPLRYAIFMGALGRHCYARSEWSDATSQQGLGARSPCLPVRAAYSRARVVHSQ